MRRINFFLHDGVSASWKQNLVLKFIVEELVKKMKSEYVKWDLNKGEFKGKYEYLKNNFLKI